MHNQHTDLISEDNEELIYATPARACSNTAERSLNGTHAKVHGAPASRLSLHTRIPVSTLVSWFDSLSFLGNNKMCSVSHASQ